MREHGDEFVDMDSDIGVLPVDHGFDAESDYAASENGRRDVGFRRDRAQRHRPGGAGLTNLALDDFGGGPRMPMVPGTWGRGSRTEGEGHRRLATLAVSNRIHKRSEEIGIVMSLWMLIFRSWWPRSPRLAPRLH